MIRLRRSQEKILYLFGIITCAFILFWLFIYLPQGNLMRQLRVELNIVEGGIKGVEAVFGKGEPPDQAITRLEERLTELRKKCPQEEGSTLRLLSERANNLGVRIISIKPARKKVFGSEKEPIVIEDSICNELSITMELVCDYMALGRYLESLREDFPTLITVSSLKMRGDLRLLPKLKIELEIVMYMLIPR